MRILACLALLILLGEFCDGPERRPERVCPPAEIADHYGTDFCIGMRRSELEYKVRHFERSPLDEENRFSGRSEPIGNEGRMYLYTFVIVDGLLTEFGIIAGNFAAMSDLRTVREDLQALVAIFDEWESACSELSNHFSTEPGEYENIHGGLKYTLRVIDDEMAEQFRSYGYVLTLSRP